MTACQQCGVFFFKMNVYIKNLEFEDYVEIFDTVMIHGGTLFNPDLINDVLDEVDDEPE